MRKGRFIVGVICLVLSVWIFLVGDSGGTTAPAVTIAVLGIIMIAISRRR